MSTAIPLARVALSRRPHRRVLVIDDDELVRRVLGDAFTRRGFEAIVEADGHAGLRRIADELLALDLVVTDLVMPDGDGEELVYRIRLLGGELDPPIVVVSAHAGDEARARLEALGADAVLDKALGPERVAELAAACAGPRRGAREAQAVRPETPGARERAPRAVDAAR